MEEHPDAYLYEIAKVFGCSSVSVHKALKRLGITRKKATLYKEINQNLRQAYLEKLEKLPAELLIYVDETGIDKYLYREYARAPRGQTVIEKISGRRYKRTNIVSGLCQGKWLAPLQYNGTTDSILFEYWFEHCLLPVAPKGSIIILDNATFHKKSQLQALANSFSCSVLFLPPYSPDLNPIENMWAWLKRKLREILSSCSSLDEAIQTIFQFN